MLSGNKCIGTSTKLLPGASNTFKDVRFVRNTSQGSDGNLQFLKWSDNNALKQDILSKDVAFDKLFSDKSICHYEFTNEK